MMNGREMRSLLPFIISSFIVHHLVKFVWASLPGYDPSMKTINDALVYGIKSSKDMVDALTADLKGSEWNQRAVPDSNCPAWLIGHLILTDRRALALAGVTDLPELPAGFEARFGREGGAPQAAGFGEASILMPLFDKQRDLLMNAIATLPASQFDQPLPKPHPRFKTLGEFFLFMGAHVMMHAGQISTVRRSLGRPPLF